LRFEMDEIVHMVAIASYIGTAWIKVVSGYLSLYEMAIQFA
jgi:hypothetical protein